MDPVDRYLRTIQRYLPPDERDDIVAELSANIYAAIEDRERELGRPLDDAEREAILDAHGNPDAAGLRYASDGPHFTFGRLLVGPALFPFYIRILAINLLVACIIAAVAAVYDIPSWSGFANIFAHVALQFGIVTVVFASIQRYLDRRSLPERSGEGGIRVKRNAQRVARLQSFSTLVIVVWTNVWLIGILRANDFFQPHPGDVLVLTPVWHQIALPYVILVAIELVRNTVNLARPSLVRFRAAAIAVESGVALLAVAILLRGGSLVTAAGANDVHEIALASGIDRTAFVSLIVTGIVLVCICLWQLRKMFGRIVAPTIVVAVGLVALVAATCGSPVSAQTSVTLAPAVLAGRCAANALPEIDAAAPHWNGWGVDETQSRFQPAGMAALDAEHVPQLRLKWAFGFPGMTRAYGQPTVFGGRVFVGSADGHVYALSARTGCVAWAFDAGAPVRTAVSLGRIGQRWAAYFGDQHANGFAVDAVTGTPIWKTRLDEYPAAIVTGAPILFGDKLYVPTSSQEEAMAADPGYA